jgi:hypothetical protein
MQTLSPDKLTFPVYQWPTLPAPLFAAFTLSRRCFSIQPVNEVSVRSAAD